MLKKFQKLTLGTIVFTVCLFLLWGCSSFSFKTDFDPEIDMSGYKTYMWYAGKMPDDDVLSANPLVKKRIAAGIDKALQAKGYSIGTEDAYDFVVIIHAGNKEKMQVTNYGGYGMGGYGRGWGGYGYGGGYGGGQTDVYQYDETTLVIDIYDASKKEMVWRGTVTGIVKDNPSREEQEENIHNVVTKMLEDFPPEKK
jgi:hypothetical protein